MYIIDWKFRRHPGNYMFQSVLAIVTIVLILLFLDVEIQTALIASLGATAFTVFSRPNYFMSRPRAVFGGYLAGMSSGLILDYFSSFLTGYMPSKYVLIISGAVAVGLAIFLMELTNTEHAPAAGIALGLTLNEWNVKTLVFIIGAVLFILLVRNLFRTYMINLIGEPPSSRPCGMKIAIPAVAAGEMLPRKYTSEGENISPPLKIQNVPHGTVSLALELVCYRKFGGCGVHWLMWNIPADTVGIEEDASPPGIKGLNDAGTVDYAGPAPGAGKSSYYFKIYALNSEIELPESSSITELERAMEGHVIEKASLQVKA